MAEAIAVIGFVSAIASLADCGERIVKRLNEFRKNVKELPQSFLHISVQLPLLVDIIHRLHDQSKKGELTPTTENLLKPVLDGLYREIQKLDAVLGKILPSADASTWEKSVKALKSVSAQKDVDEFAAIIRDYVANLTAFQTTHNSDLIRRLGTFLAEQQSSSRTPEPVPVKKPTWLNKYDSDPDFVGRDQTLEDIEWQLKEKNHRVALAGIGGVGKSRIAIQYCYRFRQQFPETNIFWVYGGSKSRFEADYQRIAISLQMPDWEDHTVDTLRQVCDWLSDERNGPWLMILDSADDHDLWLGSSVRETSTGNRSLPLIDYLPRCDHGGIIVTTRDSQLGYRLVECKQNPIQVMRFEPKEASVLLLAKLSEDKCLSLEDADELTKALEYLPLTITQAAAYLKQIDISASEYLQLFRKGEADIPNLLAESIDDPGRDRETSNSVFQTWKISYDQIMKQSPAAADILSLMAMLDRQAISQALLQGPEDPLLQFRAAISKLKAFSLVSEEKATSKFSLHRLVQLSTQKWLEHQGRLLMWEQAALATVARIYPTHAEYDAWPLAQDLNAHVRVVLKYSITTKTCQVGRASILHGLGHYLFQQGHTIEAREMLEESRKLRLENLGPEHLDTLITLSQLGAIYNKLRQSDEAYELQTHVLEITERKLGSSHWLTLKAMSRLASTYNNKGDHKKAKDLQRQCLELMERELGPMDQITLTELANLTYTYMKLRQWRNAEVLGLKTLDLRTKILGPIHPDTLTAMASLAWNYREQRRWKESEQLEWKVLKHRTEVLGPDNPKTLNTMSNLVRLHGDQKQWKEAIYIQQQAVESYRRTSGPNHPHTRRAQECLARLEANQERHELKRSSNSHLVPPDPEIRSRSESVGSSDSYQPSHSRRRSGGSLSSGGRRGADCYRDCYRPTSRSVSPYPERDQMDWEVSPNRHQN